MGNIFESEIEEILKQKKKVNEAAKNSKDVKDGLVTEEEELKEPTYVLINALMDTVKSVMNKPEVAESLEKIVDGINNKGDNSAIVKNLIEFLIMVITTTSYESIICYDELLKDEISGHFDTIIHAFNLLKADVTAHGSALEVHKKHLSEIDNKLKIDDISKKMNI